MGTENLSPHTIGMPAGHYSRVNDLVVHCCDARPAVPIVNSDVLLIKVKKKQLTPYPKCCNFQAIFLSTFCNGVKQGVYMII
jgi:hypothetical protein